MDAMDAAETDDHNDIPNAVDDIINASKVPAKRRGAPIRPTVDRLCSSAYERGLLPEPLSDLIDLLTRPSHLDQASLNALARNLYPAEAVAGDVALRVVGCLGVGELKPSLAIQAALLRWLVMVYHVIDGPGMLSRAYPILFNLLDVAAIRPQICHVLALVTRRKHVQPFRIQAVLSLSRQTGKDPSLVGLLRVFKDYYPEIIVGEAVRGKASAFKHPDAQWRLRLDEIQQAHSRRLQGNAAFTRQDGFQVRHKSFGRPRNSVIPSVHTSHATEESVTLEEIDSAASFVKNIESILLPSQLVAVLADPLLQKLLLLRPDEEAYSRINNWMTAMLQDIRSGEADSNTVSGLLGLLHEYTVVTKNIPPLVLNFFVDFLKAWDGKDGRDSVLGILAHAPLLDFEKLYDNIFGPLETCVLDGGAAATQLAMLNLYTTLFRQWAALLLSSDTIPEHAATSVTALAGHVHKLALTVLQTSGTLEGEFAAMEFLEQYAAVVSDPRLRRHIPIAVPPAALIYTLFFSQSLDVMSRLCAVLSTYKRAFATAMSTSPGSAELNSASYDTAEVSNFNGFMMDIVNCIWRTRAFTDADPNAKGCLMSRARVRRFERYVESLDADMAVPVLLGLSHSPILSLQSILAVRELEDHAMGEEGEDDGAGGAALTMRHPGPVTQVSLAKLREEGGLNLSWQDYRLAVLQRLEELGFVGIPRLMRSTMKILRGPKGASSN